MLEALARGPGVIGMPNFTFAAADYLDAYDAPTLARLRRAIQAYDPAGVMAIGRALDV